MSVVFDFPRDFEQNLFCLVQQAVAEGKPGKPLPKWLATRRIVEVNVFRPGEVGGKGQTQQTQPAVGHDWQLV
ncbi:hypothetical protein BLX24_16945 [Arsenicibacter rosenii]|uniref:Uncharacterized protein n=1 Tax=Arsenicibacter rosenii TaxID=1750698 RepID=A0A1S2VIX6_9BACT|nr:hypothetical protein BLX24_16945 [Arsenicibacter rosenii]